MSVEFPCFNSPMRQNSKMVTPLPVYKGKSYHIPIPPNIPMKSDSSGMFENAGGRGLLTKLAHQIVDGFVGSKPHPGTSVFVSDFPREVSAVVCQVFGLMTLGEEKPNSLAPNLLSSDYVNGSQPEVYKKNACEPGSYQWYSSKKCDPRDCRPEYMAVVPENTDPTLNPSKYMIPPNKRTYSSVVDGTFKRVCAQSGSSTMENSNQKDQLPSFQSTMKHPSIQSYADVARIIPNKPMARSNQFNQESAQNLKDVCNISKRNITQDKKVVNHKINQNESFPVDDVVSNRDTRWKRIWKCKKPKLQRDCPIEITTNSHSSSSSETLGENSNNASITKDTKADTCSEFKWAKDEELISPGCSRGGLTERHPSECSLDSEDSFVVFEDFPDTAVATSSCIAFDLNSSLEEIESEDDDSSSSSDSSDFEDDDVDNIEHPLKYDGLSSNSCVKKDFTWKNECSTQIKPEKLKRMKKVQFAEGPHLAVIRPMIAWSYAYRESRRGPWEVYARDRDRFHCRIATLAPVLNAILDPLHRRKVMESRFRDI